MRSLTRFVEIVLCGLLLTALTPAYSASFGRSTVGATPSAGLRADFKRGSKVVLTEKGTAKSICIYVDLKGGGTGSQAVRLALYRDRNGVPGELVLETQSGDFPASPTRAADWYCYPSAAVPLEPGAYWAMIHSGSNPGIVRYYYDGAANWYGNVDLYSDGSADQAGSGSPGEGTISINVEYIPDSQVRFAGRRTVASQASSPMSSSYKRGSRVIVNESGWINSFSVYVDGLGGASGTQGLTLALYNDVNNEPSALLAQAPVTFLSPMAGRSGRWVTAEVRKEQVPVVPGAYWLVLHTTGPAGVMRYYLDGTNNWRGNANPGAVVTDLFGPATTGDGTASAFVIFTPKPVVQYTYGQTTPGTIPSKGLSADFMRGSATQDPYVVSAPMYMMELWAYLDGRGGATGSQKVRLALYDTDVSPMNLLVQSGEVTIASGAPPAWVRFPIPYTLIHWSQHYPIMIMSSGTAGVVRNYATSEAGLWMGAAAPYASGAPSTLYEGANPAGQPVVQRGTGRVAVFGRYQAAYTP